MKNKRKTYKESWQELKQDFGELKSIGKDAIKDIKADLPSKSEFKAGFKQVMAEEKRKKQEKEAAYNPSGFTRIITAASVIFWAIIAIMLIPTIVGIPISALILAACVWAWRKYVVKKPETLLASGSEIESLRKRIEELESGKHGGN